MPTHHNLIRHWRFVLYICEGIFLKMLHGILYIQIKVYNITLITYYIMYIYQFLFHFGPPLPGILTRPHVMLRPFVMSNDTERPWSTILLLSDCVRGEAAPVPLIRTAASRCWVYCIVATSRVSPVYRSSARSPQRLACVFSGRVTEAVEAAHVPVHLP